MMDKHLLKGELAERLALEYLQNRSLKLMANNWRCPRGEIDLIMLDQKTLVFIEVRYRKQTTWGLPSETIILAKRHKIIMAAQLFLQKNKQWLINPCRFDVISITGNISKQSDIQWLTNVF